MTANEFLSARTVLEAIKPQDLAKHRKDFLYINKLHMGSDIICYLIGSACLAALGAFSENWAMVIVASIVALALVAMYLLAGLNDQRDFAKATAAVNVQKLPNKLTLTSEADPVVRTQLFYLLNCQGNIVYRYQISGLYDVGRKQRISALQTAQ
ncbi:hypothetical protein [Marinobacter salicampi]|uniref:hypothetical protein n=1 Tax=Marinobacter salicampi TaxID=435907 RepID=UPI00140E0295|nr:hypothetical protein [Marinobacter salicampi]